MFFDALDNGFLGEKILFNKNIYFDSPAKNLYPKLALANQGHGADVVEGTKKIIKQLESECY